VRVVGINEPVRICELIDMADAASEQDKKRVIVFHEALAHFENRVWNLAAEGFREALSIKKDDGPSKLYLERSEKFVVTMPDDKWDGVFNMLSK
jgi:adenylate cyclase